MWKKIRYALYFIVLIIVFSVTYNFREYYYVPLIQQSINKVTDYKLKFRNFSLELPFNLALYDIEYDNKVFIDKASLRFEPFMFFKNIANPLKSLSALKINTIFYVPQSQDYIASSNKKKTTFQKIKFKVFQRFLSFFNVNCEIDKVKILYKDKVITSKDADIVLNKGIDIGGDFFYSKQKVHTKGNIKLEGDYFTTNFYTETEGIVKTKFDLLGTHNFFDGSFEYNIDTKELFVNRLDLGNFKTNIKKDSTTFVVNSNGDNIKTFFQSKDFKFDTFKSTGTIIVRDISDVLNSKISYSATLENKLLNLKIDAKDTFIFGNNFGDFNFKVNNKNEVYNVNGYHNSDNSFETKINKDGSYHTDVFNNKKKVGYLSGNYKKGEVAVDIKNIPIKKLPFIENFSKTAKGKLSLYGNIGTKSGTIYLVGKQIASKKLKGFDVFGKFYKQDYKWFADLNTQDNKLVMNAFYENKKNNNLRVSYNGVDISNVLKIVGIKKPKLSGKAVGKFEYYSKDFTTIVDINFKNGTLLDNKFDTFDVVGRYSNNQISISTFSFNGPKTKMQIKSFIDFTKQGSNSYFNTNISNFKFKGISLNCDLTVNGKLTEHNEIVGNLSVDKLELGRLKFVYKSLLLLSKEKIKMYELNNDNGLSGEIVYDLSTKNISSFIQNTDSRLSKYNPKMKGRLNSQTTFSGTLRNPRVVSIMKIKNGFYKSLLFNLDTKVEYKNRKLYLENFEISAGEKIKSKISGSGILDKENTNIKVKFKDVSEETINKYVGFRTPLKGVFYGDGKVVGKLNNLKYILNLYADTLYVKTIKFNSFVSKFTAQNKVMSIEDAKIKMADSEIKILSANFDVKKLKYNSKFKFVNTHLGPFDIFGNIDIDGNMVKKDKAHTYKGNIKFINLWLNEEKIDELMFKYSIIDRNFSFKTSKDSKLKISGNVSLKNYPKVSFKNILLNYDKQYYKFNGSVSSDKIDLNMIGKQLNLATLTSLFNFPIDVTGALDFKLNGKGLISSPTINLSINSSNGSVYNVPFDLCDIKLDAKDNKISIDKFDIKKSGKYNFIVDGFFPFWLDPKLRSKMMKEKVNVSYKLTDNGLYILKNLSQDKIVTKKGNLKIDGTLTGIRKNISNTGKLILDGSNIKTDSYVSKIKDLKVDVVWDNNLFKIKEAVAKVGSGVLETTGSVKMQGILPSFYDLNMFTTKKGVPIVVKELPIPTSGVFKMESGNFANFSKGVPVFNFKLYGNAKRPKLTGTVELENTRFCYPSPIKHSAREISDLISELFKNLYIDIDLKSATNTKYENSFVNAELKGGVNLKGNIDEIHANGVMTSDDGLFSYLGNDFTIVNSRIEIINNELFITAEGESEVYNTGDSTAEVIKVYVDRSDIRNIKTRFASKNDPTMDSKKALARLTKTDPSQTNALDTSTDFLVKQQAIRMFSSSIATPLANTVLKKTGIVDNVRLGFVNQDTLQIDSKEEASMAELLYGMKYSVEKNINRLLQVGYSVTFDKIQKEIDLKQALEMSFKVNRNLFLKGSYGLKSDNPDYEPDKRLMIEQRLRF